MRISISILLCVVGLSLYGAPLKDVELIRLTCDLEKAMTQGDMNVASAKIAGYWDRRLATIEKKIEAKLNATEQKAFSASKERWGQHRSLDVTFRAGIFEGGSIQPLIANSHYSEMTEHRVIELESFYTDALSH